MELRPNFDEEENPHFRVWDANMEVVGTVLIPTDAPLVATDPAYARKKVRQPKVPLCETVKGLPKGLTTSPWDLPRRKNEESVGFRKFPRRGKPLKVN